MRWPDLVPEVVCATPIQIIQTDGIGEDGAPAQTLVFDGKCNYSEKSKQVLTADRQLITISGIALFHGDILPDKNIVEGFANVLGKRQRIFRSVKARNPDGTVNYTSLELF